METSTGKMGGLKFVAAVLSIIFSIHLTFVFCVWAPKLWEPGSVTILFVYHLLFSNLLASLFQCVVTEPGVVPPNWGFYMGDETKRRRYCKMCNVWKPDRTHHCSQCNRCVLNMDHHCPWINNCVGFYNRKFFIQLLVYVFACLSFVAVATLPDIVVRIRLLVGNRVPLPVRTRFYVVTTLVFLMFLLTGLLLATLANFLKFHLKLVLENFTTIENMEREEGSKSKFDIGRRRNWEQVFGNNPWLWWCPLHTSASRPVGDGVRWRVHYTRVTDDDEEPADDAGPTAKWLSQSNRQ